MKELRNERENAWNMENEGSGDEEARDEVTVGDF